GEGRKKRRRGRARRDDDGDEKGMYLQLLAQSQPMGPPSRRGNADFAGRRREGCNRRGGGGGGSGGDGGGGSSRAEGRFAFIN
ncbi:unnamed protein product, partial [Laminaria digitata]